MARESSTTMLITNIMFLCFTIVTIGTLIYLYSKDGTYGYEQKLFLDRLISMSIIFIFVVLFLGLMGLCCKDDCLLLSYLVLMFFAIVGLIAFTGFLFMATEKGSGKAVNGVGFKEYRLEDFSKWLRERAFYGQDWEEIEGYLMDAQVCTFLGQNDVAESDFYMMKLTPLQAGCCKPPTSCDYEYKNATFWEVPESGPAAIDDDCYTWSNNQDMLCYECNSCKAGFVANSRKEYRILAVSITILIGFLIIIYAIGWYTIMMDDEDYHHKQFR